MSSTTHYLADDSVLRRIVSIFDRSETPAQKLWREVYVASIERGVSHITAADQADKAVTAFRDRQL